MKNSKKKNTKIEEYTFTVPSKVFPEKEAVAQSSVQPIVDIACWARLFKHAIPGHWEASLQKLNPDLPYRISPNRALNGHPYSALCRDETVRRILSREGKKQEKLTILDYYGTPRNSKFDPRQTKLPGHNVKLSVNWHCYGDANIAGDGARDLVRANYHLEQYNFAIIQDVYLDGDCNLSPTTLKRLCKLVDSGKVYVVFRPFIGEAGCDEQTSEGVWCRDREGNVLFSPEPNGVCYAPHPDCNWLLNRQFEGLDINEIAQIGPYKTVVVTETIANALPLLKGVVAPPAKVFKLEFHMIHWNKNLLSWAKRFRFHHVCERVDAYRKFWLPEEHEESELLVCSTLTDVVSKYLFKLPTGHTFDSILSNVIKTAEKDPFLSSVCARFPEVYIRIVRGSAFHVLYADRERSTQIMLDLRQIHWQSEQKLRLARNPLSAGSREGWKPLRILVILVGIFGMKYVYKCLKILFPFFFRLVKGVSGKMLAASTRGLTSDVSLVDPILEELVRRVSPKAGLVLGLVEFIGYCIKLKKLGFPWWSSIIVRLPALLLHTGLSHLAMSGVNRNRVFVGGVVAHYAFNCLAATIKDPEPPKAYEEFLEHYKNGVVAYDQATWQKIPNTPLEGLTVADFKVSTADVKDKMDIEYMGIPTTLEQLEHDLPDDKTNYIYPILITNALPFRPNTGPRNLLAAITERIMKKPLYERDKNADDIWFEAYQTILTGTWDIVFEKGTLEEAVHAMGSKGKRLLEADRRCQDGEIAQLYKRINVKHNETIAKLRPRAIVDMDPTYHALCTADFRHVSKYMKLLFNFNEVWTINGFVVRIVYSSGMTGSQLTELGNQMLDISDVVFCLSGDDGFVSSGRYPQLGFNFKELDIKMCDQSHNHDSQMFLVDTWRAMGVSEDVLSSYLKQVTQDFTARSGEVKVRGSMRYQLPTGTTATTVGNGLLSIGAFISFLHLFGTGYKLHDHYARLGLQTEEADHETIHTGTFLKGWWQKCLDGTVAWTPLPSAIAKLGKVMRDPIHITTIRVKGKKVHLEPDRAVKQVAYQIVSSLGHIPFDVPVLGPFLKTLQRLGESPKHELEVSESTNKPICDVLYKIDRAAYISSMMARYNVAFADVTESEQLFDKINSLPAFVSHPLFIRLLEVDYGAVVGTPFRNIYAGAIQNLFNFSLMSLVPYGGGRRRNRRGGNALNNLVGSLAAAYMDPSGTTEAAKKAAAGLLGTKVAGDIAQKVAAQLKKNPGGSLRGTRRDNPPTAMSNKIQMSSGARQINKSGMVVISNRELLMGSVIGSSTFAVASSFVLNPGLITSFPWLSTQASQYEQYKFRRLVLSYIPSVGTGQSGDVILAVDYNVTDLPPTTETSILDRSSSLIGSVWESADLSLKPSEMNAIGGKKYVRSVAVAGDPKNYDSGVIYIATNNVGGNVPVGKLFVEYTVELYTPQITAPLSLTPSMTSCGYSSPNMTISKATNYNIPFTNVPTNFDPLRFFSNVNAPGSYFPPAGCYDVQVVMSAYNTVNELTQFNLFFTIGGNQYPSSSVANQAQSQGSFTNLAETLTYRAILPFNGLQTFSAIARIEATSGVLTVISSQIIVRLA